MKELKRCPFCGGAPELRRIGNDYTKSRKLTIRCTGCRFELTHAAIRHGFDWLENNIERDWNRRTPDVNAELLAALKAVRENFDHYHSAHREGEGEKSLLHLQVIAALEKAEGKQGGVR